jgi:hypothetical protein
VSESRGDVRHGSGNGPSEEHLIARERIYQTLANGLSGFVLLVGLGVFALLAVPLAHAVAGKHTDFDMTVSFSFSVALAATTLLSSGGLVLQGQRLKHHKNRADWLERRLRELSQNDHRNQAGTEGGATVAPAG